MHSRLLLLTALLTTLPTHALYLRQLPHAPNTKAPRAAALDWDDAITLKRAPLPRPSFNPTPLSYPADMTSEVSEPEPEPESVLKHYRPSSSSSSSSSKEEEDLKHKPRTNTANSPPFQETKERVRRRSVDDGEESREAQSPTQQQPRQPQEQQQQQQQAQQQQTQQQPQVQQQDQQFPPRTTDNTDATAAAAAAAAAADVIAENARVEAALARVLAREKRWTGVTNEGGIGGRGVDGDAEDPLLGGEEVWRRDLLERLEILGGSS